MSVYNALIKTHHMTSRRKISRVKSAAQQHLAYAIIKTGRSPGLMYGAGSSEGVRMWVKTVKGLRYKDFQLVRRPAAVGVEGGTGVERGEEDGEFVEVESLREFTEVMRRRGVLSWYVDAMGFKGDPLGSQAGSND